MWEGSQFGHNKNAEKIPYFFLAKFMVCDCGEVAFWIFQSPALFNIIYFPCRTMSGFTKCPYWPNNCKFGTTCRHPHPDVPACRNWPDCPRGPACAFKHEGYVPPAHPPRKKTQAAAGGGGASTGDAAVLLEVQKLRIQLTQMEIANEREKRKDRERIEKQKEKKEEQKRIAKEKKEEQERIANEPQEMRGVDTEDGYAYTYYGMVKNGKPCGHGRRDYDDGHEFVGNFQNGKKNGHGVYTNAKGNIYDGQYKDDKKNGHGVFTWANGDIYDGLFKDGKQHGHGVYTWADGDVYDGQWKDGEKNGHGVNTWASGSVYDGQWKDGKQHGHGVHTWADGRSFREKHINGHEIWSKRI